MKQKELEKMITEAIHKCLKEIYDPRKYYPKVRGGWTKNKIKRNLSSSNYGQALAIKAIAEFDDVNDFRSHLFWHGSQHLQSNLLPSIKMRQSYVEQNGGGGYGERYWGISVTSDKRGATRFSMGRGVYVHPIILYKGAKVIRREDFDDAIDVEDYIEEFWDQGVDAVYIGKEGYGEKELLVINPYAIINVKGANEYFEYHGISEKNIQNPSDEQLNEILMSCKEYVTNGYKCPQKPSKLVYNGDDFARDEKGNLIHNPNYDQEIQDYYTSPEYKEYNNRVNDFSKKMKFINN